MPAVEGPPSPLLEGPKRQHFLPRFYLDGFTRDGLVAIFDRDRREFRRQQPVNTAVVGHLYTFEDSDGKARYDLEALLSDCESRAKPILLKLVNDTGVLSLREREQFSLFVALAATRTPDMFESLQTTFGELIRQLTMKGAFANIDLAIEFLKSRQENAHLTEVELRRRAEDVVQFGLKGNYTVEVHRQLPLGMFFNLALSIAPHLAKRHWRVLHRASPRDSFATTDSPVVLDTLAPRNGAFQGVGFGTPDAVVTFALHQSCALEMYGDGATLEHKPVENEYLRRVNLRLARRCQRFLIARDEALVASLVRRARLESIPWTPRFRVG